MKVSDLEVGDCLNILGRQYNIINFTPDREPIITIDSFAYFDHPREFALNERGKKYGYDFFPITTACDNLKNGKFRIRNLTLYCQELFNPVTTTYLKPNGYKNLGLGKETVTMWAYPETKETRSRRCDAYVDEYGIRRDDNDKAITPNRYRPVRAFANLKPDLQVMRINNAWTVTIYDCVLSEPLNSFLGITP